MGQWAFWDTPFATLPNNNLSKPVLPWEPITIRSCLLDFVKFRIAAINNDGTDGEAVYMHFRAFLDNMSDNYEANWNSIKYVGRGEPLYNYEGFGRTISLGFTVAAQSKAELIPMYKKLNYLIAGEKPTIKKINTAKELNIKIIDQKELLKMLNQTG